MGEAHSRIERGWHGSPARLKSNSAASLDLDVKMQKKPHATSFMVLDDQPIHADDQPDMPPSSPFRPSASGEASRILEFQAGGVSDFQSADLEDMQLRRVDLTWNEIIGTGGTAEVWSGEWRGKEVAIKKMSLSASAKKKLHQDEAFFRESAIALTTSHPNLVQFFGLACETMPFLLVTEFCHGGACYELLHESNIILSIDQKVKMCSDVANGMDYLHRFRPQIIHRDLKSLNLLLAQPVTSTADNPVVKISDFGLAKMKELGGSGWGEMSTGVGTFHWMAPEVRSGQYTEKADVYSFAMVMYEVTCQAVPFASLGKSEVVRAAFRGSRPSLEVIPPSVPDVVVQLMQQCWAHEPADRPAFGLICKRLEVMPFDLLRFVRQTSGASSGSDDVMLASFDQQNF